MKIENTIEKLKSTVIIKTNRFVYFSDGTHMNYSDFHKYKQDLRKELQLVVATELKDSIEMVVTSLKDKRQLEELLYELQDANNELYYDIHSLKTESTTDWEKRFRKECENSQKIKIPIK